MPYILNRYYPTKKIIFFLGEGLLIFLAINATFCYFIGPEIYSVDPELYLFRAGLVTVVFQLCLYFFDLYDLNAYSTFPDTATRMTQAFGFGCIALAGIYYLFPESIISTKVFWTGYILICFFLAFWRFIYVFSLKKRLFVQPVVVLGTGKLAGDIAAEILGKLDSGFKIVAFVGAREPAFNHGDVPWVEDSNQLSALCRESDCEHIVVALDERRGSTPVETLVQCKLDGILVSSGIGFLEDLTGKIFVQSVNPDWIIYSDGFSISRFKDFLKRFGDILLSTVGILLAAPIMIVSALIIKLESEGPVFYLQERVGKGGQPFQVIKFRSMGKDAEKDGAVWAQKNDARVTRYGGFMRKTRIDEIPQLFNVFKGEMSFVGPRPERPVFVNELNKKIPYYSLRHNIKPGITGWAQICYPYGASEEDALHKLEYDLYYMKNLSLSMDLSIAFQTIKTVLFQKGGR